MKKYFAALLLPLCFLYLLCFPQAAASFARNGLILWYRSVLPVLFPFFFLSGLILHLMRPERAPAFLRRISGTLFGCSPAGALVLASGFLCGCPVGARLTRQFQKSGKISRQEAWHLYGFANNLSPGFLVSCVAAGGLYVPECTGWFLFQTLGAALLYGMLTAPRRAKISGSGNSGSRSSVAFPQAADKNIRKVSAPSAGNFSAASTGKAFHGSSPEIETTETRKILSFSVIDSCISGAVESSLRLCAYIVLFSILSGAAAQLLPTEHPIILLAVSFLEATNGVHLLAESRLPFYAKYLAVTALCSFGGFSALAQTAGIAEMDRSLLWHYLKSRICVALLALLLSAPALLSFR